MMFNIFLIEDDKKLESMVKEYLERYGYKVHTVNKFNEIEEEFKIINPDLVLLDINLPYYDGFYLCRLFRKSSNVPIVVISARSDDMEQVMGIELGADDYIVKPFSYEILIAKIKASLRREYGEYANKSQDYLNIKGLILDESTFKMTYKGKEIDLSKNEFKLIKKLIENKDKVVSREELLETLWDDIAFVDDNTLTVNVTRIKQKLGNIGVENSIKTKRGVGYSFESSYLNGDIDE